MEKGPNFIFPIDWLFMRSSGALCANHKIFDGLGL